MIGLPEITSALIEFPPNVSAIATSRAASRARGGLLVSDIPGAAIDDGIAGDVVSIDQVAVDDRIGFADERGGIDVLLGQEIDDGIQHQALNDAGVLVYVQDPDIGAEQLGGAEYANAQVRAEVTVDIVIGNGFRRVLRVPVHQPQGLDYAGRRVDGRAEESPDRLGEHLELETRGRDRRPAVHASELPSARRSEERGR